MTKKTLKHMSASGNVETRTTARDYTHVVEARVILANCRDDKKRQYEISRSGLSECGQFTDWFVLAWCGREDLADTAVNKYSKPPRPVWEVKAVAINDGVREA